MSTTTQTTAEIREQARQVYRQSVDAEMPLSGRKLGEMFDKGERWGRLRIQECQPAPTGGTTGTGAERHADAGRHGGTADRHSAGDQAAQDPEPEDELPLDEADQDEDLSDPEPPEGPADDISVSEPSSTGSSASLPERRRAGRRSPAVSQRNGTP